MDHLRLNSLPLDGHINIKVRFIEEPHKKFDKSPVEKFQEELEISSFMSENLSQPF